MSSAAARVELVSAAVVRPLRQAVLRPHERLEQLVWPGDDVPGAAHAAAYVDGTPEPVGVASITPEPHPTDPAPGDWRLRGMATAPQVRGLGLGAQLLAACADHARAAPGARRVWCNARTPAQGFYERAGFVAEGEAFPLGAIGPHVRMALAL